MSKLVKIILIVLVLVIIFIGLVFYFRFVLGGNEDTWICSQGQWVKHGNPSEPMPVIPCKQESQGKSVENIFPTGTVNQVSFEESKKIAEDFAVTVPTYKFDGSDMKYETSEALPCPYCWRFDFSYTSSHAGWGDRKELVQAQVITPHKLSITVKEGVVAAAVSDETYDEMNNIYMK